MKILMSRIALEEIGPAMSARIGADNRRLN
jgi:hypothetical protein